MTETFNENPGLIAWGKDGIYFGAAHGMERLLYRLNPSTRSIEQVSGTPRLNAGGFSFSSDLARVAYAADRDNEYGEIYAATLAPWTPTRLTMGDQLKGLRIAHREVVSWMSGDGTRIEGVLITLGDFDPHRKYPLLVVIHGGPTGTDRASIYADRYYPVERFVAEGAVVLRPNYRGSAGYGEKFRSLNVRNLGAGDYANVISGVDALIAKGFVDKDRVGAIGLKPGRLHLGLHYCIQRSVQGRLGRRRHLRLDDVLREHRHHAVHPQYLHATPWDDPEIYKKTSPISYIAKARTPTLIQHGELDRRVPIPNAYELREALEDRGVPVRMVVYKGFGHGIDKPKQQRAVMEENEKWFGQYVLTGSTALSEKGGSGTR